MVGVFRLEPQLPAGAMKTYQVIAPKATHFRNATCAEIYCSNYLNGWKTEIDESSELGQKQAYYIRNSSGRHYKEDRSVAAGLTIFVFEAGQQCFSQHQVRLDKPEIYLVKGGDWRGNPAGIETKKHSSPDDWVDDFANHQDNLAEKLKEG